MSYSIHVVEHVGKKLRKMKNRDPALYRRVEDAIRELARNPRSLSVFLKGEFKGKRKFRKGRIRIVFAICEECRRLGHLQINQCVDCDEIPSNAIKIFDIGLRGQIY